VSRINIGYVSGQSKELWHRIRFHTHWILRQSATRIYEYCELYTERWS